MGEDLPLRVLKNHYHAILFAYGASRDRKLAIPGEDRLSGIYSARDFVGWYNGLPEFANLKPRLDAGDTAVVIGQGNVALDVARTLLSDVDSLRKTDVTEEALELLSRSRVKRIHVVGRRGPMQASLTIKEVRELINLPSVAFRPVNRSLLPSDISELARAPKRMAKLLIDASSKPQPQAQRSWGLDFFLSPIRFCASQSNAGLLSTNEPGLESIEFMKMQPPEESRFDPTTRVSSTGENTSLAASLAFRSIGYLSEALDGMADIGLHFDETQGIISNDHRGRATRPAKAAEETVVLPGMYCAGWVKRGPTGVIANTMEDSFATAEAIVADWKNKSPFLVGGHGWETIKEDLNFKNMRTVSWQDWIKIDAAEKARGRLLGKPREKFTNVQNMLEVL